MPDPDDSRQSAVLCDFLDLWLDDRSAGRSRPLAEYLRRFPGHEEQVAREFLALSDGAAPAPAGAEGAEGGDRLGHYRLLQPLGRGGQGTVYLAEDVRLGRHVALKILDGSLGGLPATRLARLKREAEALSRLDHPRLCALYDADLSGDRPYFAMRYVPGETLAQRIERARSDAAAGGDGLLSRMPATSREIEAVVRFVELAARAVHVAHEAGIVHRDLKPGNIMIDQDSEPVVLDFGLARDAAAGGTAITMTGDAFGTLAYMAPEQLSGAREIDRRADVHSLGVTLYESLTLRRPVEAPTREMLLKGILAGERQDPELLNRALPRDLAVVLGHALDVDPDRRYPTALALAEDLRRVRAHEPILARPAGWWLLTRRWAQRHPAAFAGGLATFTLLVAGLAITIALLARVTREQAQTRIEQSRLAALRQAYLAQILGNEKPALALRVAIDAARREPHAEINNILYDLLDRCYEKATYAIGGKPNWVALGYEPAVDAKGRLLVAYAGGVAAFDLATGAREDLVADLSHETGLTGASRLAITRDLRTLASVHPGGTLRLFDLGDAPRMRATLTGLPPAPTWIEFSPDERRIVLAGEDGAAEVRDLAAAAAAPVRFSFDGRSVTTARWAPSGSLIAVTGLDRPGLPGDEAPAAVVDAATGRVVARLGPPGASAIWSAWSHDGTRLAVACDSAVFVYRSSDWGETGRLVHGDLVRWLAFHPDGRRLVTGSRDGVCAWDVASGARIAAAGGFRERSVIRGAFSPDGSQLAVIAWDQTASIVSCDTWRETRKFMGLGRPRGVCWSPDGALVSVTDEATAIHVCHAADRPHLPVLRGHADRVVAASFHPDGARALTGSLDGKARVFDVATGRVLHAMDHGRPLAAAAFAGPRVLTSGGGRAAAWDAGTGALVRDLAAEGAAVVDAWPLADGRVLATYVDGTARLWDLEAGAVASTFEGHRGPVVSAAFHEGKGLAATGGSDRTVRIHDLRSGRTVATLAFSGREDPPPGTDLSRVFAVAFDGAGERLIAGCEDLRLRIWDLRSGALLREDRAPTPGMLSVDAKGRWLVAASKWLGRVMFLDLSEPGAALRSAPFHDSHMIAAVRFSRSGDFAMAASKDGTVRLWRMEGISQHAVIDARCGILLDAGFSADGGRVIVAGSDGTARIWPVHPLAVAERVCPVSDPYWTDIKPTLDQALFTK
jgi:WD40 repeat protein